MQDIIKNLVKEGMFSKVKDEIVKMNVVDIASLLEELEEEKMLIIFRLLPKDISAEVFSYMHTEQQQYIIEVITDKEIQTITDRLFLDDTVDILEEMPSNVVKKILKNTTKQKRQLINLFLKYPENSAGSIMTIEYVDLKKEMKVKDSLEYIKQIGVDKETVDVCYVINKNRKLEGVVSLRKLVLTDGDIVIKDIMDTNFISIPTNADQEEIASLFKKYNLLAMPVVDKENRLVGIITIDDIVDVIEQENTEDFQKMAAMTPTDEEYLKNKVFTLAKHRIGWLLLLMISATFTGHIISKYEEVLQSVVVLATFIPVLMDTGGNAGSQSSTLVIRGLTLGEIEAKDILRVLWKEFRVSVIVGLVLSLVNLARIYYFEKVDFMVSFTVSISLFFTVIMAKIVGGALPIIAKKLKFDPAIMAGPLITTIVDTFALMIYFSFATRFLGISF
ncbi:MAG TPA: magnesium transporter [Defluviitaleaceae bacterium]|nr:magnesium transporter [Defluviitaleaceae bacterium]